MRGSQFAQLTAFAAVAEHRSFKLAAARLGLSRPALSEAIRGLEAAFGVRLLNRTTRSVALTEVGAQLLGHLSPVLEGVDKAIEAVNTFRDKPAGPLRLVVHPVAAVTVIAPLIARFAADYPAIRLDVSVEGERTDIVSERFDAGIHYRDAIAQDMITLAVGPKLSLSTVAAPEYLARNRAPSIPDDLRSHNCIRYHQTSERGAAWKFSNRDRQIEVPVKGSLIVNDLDLALRAALDGIGIVQLPEMSVASLVSQGRLVRVLLAWSVPANQFCLFYASRRHVPLNLRTMIDFLRKQQKPPSRGEYAQRPDFSAAPVRSLRGVDDAPALPRCAPDAALPAAAVTLQ